MFGSARHMARSSSAIWEGPSSPIDTPACEPAILMPTLLIAAMRMKSYARAHYRTRPGQRPKSGDGRPAMGAGDAGSVRLQPDQYDSVGDDVPLGLEGNQQRAQLLEVGGANRLPRRHHVAVHR